MSPPSMPLKLGRLVPKTWDRTCSTVLQALPRSTRCPLDFLPCGAGTQQRGSQQHLQISESHDGHPRHAAAPMVQYTSTSVADLQGCTCTASGLLIGREHLPSCQAWAATATEAGELLVVTAKGSGTEVSSPAATCRHWRYVRRPVSAPS